MNLPKMLASLHEFHSVFGLDIGVELTNRKCRNLRLNLIEEELRELEEHLEEANRHKQDLCLTSYPPKYVTQYRDEDIAKIADDLGDICYVVVGTAVSFKDLSLNCYSPFEKHEASSTTLLLYYGYLYTEFYSVASLENRVRNIHENLYKLLELLYNLANQFSLNLQIIFDEVHRSNMSKLWKYTELSDADFNTCTYYQVRETNRYVMKRDQDGKIIKSPSYSPFQFNPETMIIKPN
jgi:predicted HAD superfamily Cof-like phosphohydrolase